MSYEYIRTAYSVPASPGRRVEYTGGKQPRLGTIEGETGAHLMIRFDGESEADGPFHPTWELRYLDLVPSASVPVGDTEIPF